MGLKGSQRIRFIKQSFLILSCGDKITDDKIIPIRDIMSLAVPDITPTGLKNWTEGRGDALPTLTIKEAKKKLDKLTDMGKLKRKKAGGGYRYTKIEKDSFEDLLKF